MRSPLLPPTIAFVLIAMVVEPSFGIILKSTGDPSYNTNAPSGALAGSGWQYQGQFNGFLGTPIAPTFFIAAKHIAGGINMDFVLNQRTYKTIAFFDCPNADLRVFQVDQTFASFAELYTNSNEVKKHCVVFGRGTERGDAVVARGQTNGWKWGAATSIERWGENDVDSIVNDPGIGQLLYCTFDRTGGSNECTISSGDSSGGVFIQDNSQWKLAGINAGVDGPFSTDGTTATQFAAAMLNVQGFYNFDGTQWQLITTPTPSGFYSSRISAHVDWVRSVINNLPANDFRFLSAERSGNDIELTLLTSANREYRIDYATNLVQSNWTAVADVVANTNTTVVVDHAAAGQAAQRYYRLLLLK